ncbi:MAG: cell division protein FtsZ [Candidatus Micrarchaeota archaeon]|nr:cell division protein FtsZ [Candidatus Micrarchaeota archaeon]MDE1833761.1 cell division protein FtsZ [Candidatus Micrarchaeota archaeon]
MPEILSQDDEELLKFIESAKPKIYVVGAGGSGSNTATRMSELNIEGANVIAMNTDAPHLARTKSHRKILLGKKTTRGLGAGSDPRMGEESAIEAREDIKHVIGDAQLVFITCGLGGGTGTGSAPIIAHQAKEAGALTVGVVTLPFSSEGKIRMRNALEGLQKLKRATDTTIIIPNDKLLSVAPDLPLNMAFKISDEILANGTKGIIEMVTKPGMVNLDFADLRSVLKDSGYAVIGMGESTSMQNNDRATVAIENTLRSPLLDVDISGAKKALVNIIGGDDLTLREAENIFQNVSSRISSDALLKWGARIDPKMQKNSLKVMVVLSGVEFADYTENGIKQRITENQDIDLDQIFEN